MQECRLLILLALAFAGCTMATRTAAELDQDLTEGKCCKAAGDLFYFAADQLGSAAAKPGDVRSQKLPEPPSRAKFSEKICKQGAGLFNCKQKAYVFSGLTIQFTKVETLTEAWCQHASASRCNNVTTWQSVVKASEQERAEKLRCHMDTVLSKSNAIRCEGRRAVAIFAGYDDCWDIISETNPLAKEKVFNAQGFKRSYTDVIRPLVNKIQEIANMNRVILFVGSNRQSSADDIYNNMAKKNGLALGANNAFERWVQKFGGFVGHCWELNKALLSDNKQPCSAWNEEPLSASEGLSKSETKTRLLENGIKQLLLEDYVDLFFFDAHAEHLEYVREHGWRWAQSSAGRARRRRLPAPRARPRSQGP